MNTPSPAPDSAGPTVEQVVRAVVHELAPEEAAYFESLVELYLDGPAGRERVPHKQLRFGYDAANLIETTILALDVICRYLGYAPTGAEGEQSPAKRLKSKIKLPGASRRRQREELLSLRLPAELDTTRLADCAQDSDQNDDRTSEVTEVIVRVVKHSRPAGTP